MESPWGHHGAPWLPGAISTAARIAILGVSVFVCGWGNTSGATVGGTARRPPPARPGPWAWSLGPRPWARSLGPQPWALVPWPGPWALVQWSWALGPVPWSQAPVTWPRRWALGPRPCAVDPEN